MKSKKRLNHDNKLKTRRESLEILELIRNVVVEDTTLGKISAAEDSTPFKILISTILSARTHDSVTEAASRRLFARFADAKSLSRAKKFQVRKLIKPVCFYNIKSGRIIQVARIIQEKHSGRVPRDIEQLLELPGVGRKTANCVMVYAFKTPAIPVDIHVHRVSNRIGLVNTKDPDRTEEELSKLYKKRFWLDVNELFVRFGQNICKPVFPRCDYCSVNSLCNYYRNVVKKK